MNTKKTSLQKIYEKFAMLYQMLFNAAESGTLEEGLLSVFPAYDNEVERWKVALAITTPDGRITPIATFLTHDDAAFRLNPDLDSSFQDTVVEELRNDDRLNQNISSFNQELVMPVFAEGIEPFLSEGR